MIGLHWDDDTSHSRRTKTIVVEAKDPSSSSSSFNTNKNSNIKSQSLPRVLTRSVIPTLAVTSLDAGDAVECYHLTRSTLLDGTNIRITKSALGVRYRRPANEMMEYTSSSSSGSSGSNSHSSSETTDKETLSPRLELTIEFGAARAGPDLTHESMPRLVTDPTESATTPTTATGTTTTNTSQPQPQQPPRVHWDNVGRVYYTERIDSETYTTATYLASLSGTVLTKLLQSAMDFITVPPLHNNQYNINNNSPASKPTPQSTTAHRKRVRRYQPFDVYLVNETVTAASTSTTPSTSSTASSSGGSTGGSSSSSASTTTATDDTKKLIFHSSNDADFVLHVLSALAELGVAIQPVILPTTFQIQLHAATHVTKLKVHTEPFNATTGTTTTTTSSAVPPLGIESVHPTLFYQKLFSCIQAISSANYSAYNTTVSSASSAAAAAAAATTTTTTNTNSTTAVVPTTPLPVSMIVRPPKTPRALTQQQQRQPAVSPNRHSSRTIQARTLSKDTLANGTSAAASTLSVTVKSAPLTLENAPNLATMVPTVVTNASETETIPIPPDTTMTGGEDGNEDETSMASHQEQAATAAEQAQIAANAAGAAGTEEQAVSAAQQAAVYAHKAATVTAQQAASMARDAMLSGVGSSVAQAMALCFSDPLYGLVTTNTASVLNGTINETTVDDAKNASASTQVSKKSTTTAYIYWDGLYYYQVNLTSPYVTVSSFVRTMPQPPVMGIGAEDYVDWTIALLLVACASIGFLLLLQQIMGRNLKVIRPLYRYQRWFFAPTHFAWKDIVSDDSESVSTRGLGQHYTFGEDVIPLSMGGRRPSWLNGGSSRGKVLHHSYDDDDDFDLDSDDIHDTYDNGHSLNSMTNDLVLGDLELTETRPLTPTPRSGNYSRGLSFLSDGSVGGCVDEDLDRIVPQSAPIRLYRDPNLVDLPDCTF